jgi:subtilase family serine protease
VYPVQQNVTAGNNVTYLIIVSSTLPTNLTLQISAETNSTQLTLQTRSPSNSSILAEGKMRIARLQVFAAPEAAPGNYTITLLVTVTGAEQTLTSSRQLELQVISSKNAFATPTALTTCIIILGVIVIIAIAYMALRSRKRASRKRLQN